MLRVRFEESSPRRRPVKRDQTFVPLLDADDQGAPISCVKSEPTTGDLSAWAALA